jgi:hypothetical protein
MPFPFPNTRFLAASFLILAGGFRALHATEAPIDFNRDIRPILSNNCFWCHGPDEAERKGGNNGLRLDTFDGAREDLGGYQALAPGNPDQSELLKRVLATDDDDIMPPRKTGKSVTPAEVELLRRWIAQGGSYAQHWSYEAPKRPEPPAVQQADWARTPIDRFILARLEAARLKPQPEADRRTLARRVALDLTGLPPTPADVEAFVADPRPDAYERFVDTQLARPAYGEHWARSWLDLARYADSRGYADDQPRSIWRYRDYVIDAFNRNLPFDQFTVEQLAGDLLPNPTAEQVYATGFHRNTMNNTEGGTDDEEFRSVAVIDRVNTTFAVWMGSSMACAQCHTHKYDPFTITEYFQLYAILNQTEDADRNDEAPFVEFYTAEQEGLRAQWKRQIQEAHARVLAKAPAHAAAADTWAAAFPAKPSWRADATQALRFSSGSKNAVVDTDARVFVPAGATKETVSVELSTPRDQPVTAIQVEALPHASLAGGGAGGAEGRFVVTRARVGVKGAAALPARYIRVELPGPNRTLPLAEVEVFGEGRNLAREGRAYQTSVANGAEASRAIDGKTDGDFSRGSVSLTAPNDDTWWEVDLGATRTVERVVLWGRTGAESTPGWIRVLVLDENRRPLWAQMGREAPRPSREHRMSDPVDVGLAQVTASYADPEYDESYIITDAEPDPKRTNPRKRTAYKKGWGNGGAINQAHQLYLEPAKPVVLGPGETLVVTLEQTAELPNATLNHFRVTYSNEPRVADQIHTPAAVLAALAVPASTRSESQRRTLLEHYALKIAPDFAAEQTEIARLERSLKDMPVNTTLVMRELPPGHQRTTHVQLRGNFRELGDVVKPGVPAVFPPLEADRPADRLALARWLVSPANPLTARVQANRLWESIFGLGIVRTTEEFGSQGEAPTHPELLDWLATEYVRLGWDQKAFLRLLVTSAAYRQSARVTPEALAGDPENRLISRGPRFRLSAEMIRDQALAVSGLLSPRSHGPSSRPFQPASGLNAAFGSSLDWKTDVGEGRLRRGLYTEWRRSSPYPSMAAFDAPNREVCTLRRDRSNTPLQALVTMNDPVYVEAAQALAAALADAGPNPADGIRLGFERVLARPPVAAEVRALESLFADSLAKYTADTGRATALTANVERPPPAHLSAPTLAAWITVANVLLNLDETLMKR